MRRGRGSEIGSKLAHAAVGFAVAVVAAVAAAAAVVAAAQRACSGRTGPTHRLEVPVAVAVAGVRERRLLEAPVAVAVAGVRERRLEAPVAVESGVLELGPVRPVSCRTLIG
jgi:hypothetical protein